MGGDVRETIYGDFAADFAEDRLFNLCDPDSGIQTGPFGSQLHQEDYVAVGTPIITVEHLGENRILHEEVPRVSDADRDRLSRYSLRPGDIVFSRVGSVDRRALVRPDEDGWLFSGRCLRVRPNTERIDSGFLSYFFGLPAFKEHIRAIAVGATMPSLNTSILSDVVIPHPRDIGEQRAIAHILGTLDDKIELNRRMNETLEAMARALFKSWFVDFDPVRAKAEGRDPGLPPDLAALFPDRFVESEVGEVPERWEVKTIGDLVERLPVGRKYDQKTVSPLGQVVVLDQGQSGVIGYHNDRPGVIASVEAPVVVFANHTCYMRLIAFPFSAIQNVIPFTGKGVDTVWAFYATYGKQSFIEYKGHWPDFVIHQVAVPDAELTMQFAKVVHPLLKQTWMREYQSRTLAALRDALLPKLVSGEIGVREAEKDVSGEL